jgi:hypothetical protein
MREAHHEADSLIRSDRLFSIFDAFFALGQAFGIFAAVCEKWAKMEIPLLRGRHMLEVTRAGWREYLDLTRLAAMAGCQPPHILLTGCKELLDNALDESPAGGVTYEIGDRSLAVHDTGRGMSEDLACRIFSIDRASISTKRWRMAKRGMLGNGSRVIMAAVNLSGGSLIVEANGRGFTVSLDGIGGAQASDHFDSDVTIGTRITAQFGPELEWFDPSIYCHEAVLAQGTAWPSRRSSASFFTVGEIKALLGDVVRDTPIRDFAGIFDLTTEAASLIRAEFRNANAGEVAAKAGAAERLAALILAGTQPPKSLRRIGRGALDGQYAFEETTFDLGGVQLPAIVEIWATGNPVLDREKSGSIRVETIYLNRAPGLFHEHSHGTVDANSKTARLVVGNAEIALFDALKAPCNFTLTLALTAPDLPIISLGKAVDFRPFRSAIARALRQVLPKAYVRPELTLAEAKALRQQQEAPEREAEKQAAARRRIEESREKAARRRERLAKRASEAGRLNSILVEEAERTGLSRDALTVMSNDPYRIGEKAEMHTNGRWLADVIDRLSGGTAWNPIHVRGLHYRVLVHGDFVKPDGQIYGHGENDWKWKSGEVVRAGRWLEYVPFAYIFDQRSDPPVIPEPEPAALAGKPRVDNVSVAVPLIEMPPSPAALALDVQTFFPRKRNPHQIVIVGEKSGLRDLVAPIAAEYHAISYFPAGEISDTNIAEIADQANADGRELIVCYIADCDPSGRQMPTSLAHKLRAIRDLQYPDLKFRVISVALNPDQAISLGLPQSPLSQKDSRAARWRGEFGCDQIEVDALTNLMPDTLVDMIRHVADQYADPTLAFRNEAAAAAWQRQAQDVADAALTASNGLIVEQRSNANAAYRGAVAALDRYRTALGDLAKAMEAIDIDLTTIGDPPDQPEPYLAAVETEVLVDSDMPFAEHVARLVSRKGYGRGGAQ